MPLPQLVAEAPLPSVPAGTMATYGWKSRTRVAAWPPTHGTGSSIRSSPPSQSDRAWVLGYRSLTELFSAIAGDSTSSAHLAKVRRSGFGYRYDNPTTNRLPRRRLHHSPQDRSKRTTSEATSRQQERGNGRNCRRGNPLSGASRNPRAVPRRLTFATAPRIAPLGHRQLPSPARPARFLRVFSQAKRRRFRFLHRQSEVICRSTKY
jgi:hypothetical protein